MKRFYQWYKQQIGFKKWLLVFILNWLYWGIVNGITTLIFRNEEQDPFQYFLFSTTFMAIFWTVIFDGWLSPMIKRKYAIKKQAEQK